MKRTPTTNSHIDDAPLSFVRLGSRVAGRAYGGDGIAVSGMFTDSRQVTYTAYSGTVYGYPRTMQQIKREARQSRLTR